nr:isoprenylcysteine carboxylmethyltransferase family protein [Dactylosporangium thailandense]
MPDDLRMRLVIAGYAVIAYACFLLSAAWAAVFLVRGDGPATRPAAAALAIDGALLLAFAVQHTVMARAWFKRRIPAPVERSTYVLASALVLFAIFGLWQPVPAGIWRVGEPFAAAIWVLFAAGWVLVVWSTFAVDHADFLGLKQAWTHLRRRAYHEPGFVRGGLYALVRHPMMLGLAITFWATPQMSAGHLFFAVAASGYILVGIRFEERDLRARFGAEYDDYARRGRPSGV